MRRLVLLVVVSLAALPAGCKKSAPPSGPAAATTTAAPAHRAPAGDSSGVAATLKSGSQATRSRAIQMAREMAEQGEDPVPILLDALKDPTCGPLGGARVDRPTSTRETAVQALLGLGPKGKKALQE